MHKLLLRQLKRYRGTEVVPEDWRGLMDAVDEAYQSSEKDYLMLEHNLDFTSRELSIRNGELEKAFNQLKEAQASLVHSEKMAALGNLIAGIAHEINTPASAISSAIAEIKRDYRVLLEQLINIVDNFPKEMSEMYLESCKKVLNLERERTTSERREYARKLADLLKENGFTDVRSISQNLALVGFTPENLVQFLPLLKTEKAGQIVQSLFDLGMSQIHVGDIAIAIARITFLVRALKSYSHAGQAELMLTDLKEDLNNTLVILHNKLKRAVKLTTEFGDIPKIKCYADELNQVWTNIINNSVEAMHGEGNISIRTKAVDGQVLVEIEDNGPGIAADVMPRIFEPYFTTKPKGEGTGLGLSISKTIVEKNQGTISVESEPGRTLFKVLLPVEVKVPEENT